MNKLIKRLICAALFLCMLPCVQSCKPVDPQGSQGGEEQSTAPEQIPEREVYEDLSATTVPLYQGPGAKSCTVTANGKSGACEQVLDFTQMDGRYMISPIKINFSCHNVAECPDCGYVSLDGEKAYRFSSDGLDQGGVTVTLATPLLASSVRGMKMTFKTTADAGQSEMRVLTAAQTNNAAFINKCASMAGAVQEWKTIDLGVQDFSELADSDGYIRSFQIYFRNKNRADCYVQSIVFSVGAESLLSVDTLSGNCFFRGGALEALAATIAARFEEADLAAEITVTNKKYKKNSGALTGNMHYGAVAVLADGTELTCSHEVVIPPVSGVWLDASDGQYGASHDSHGQWQQTLDPGGLLFLTDNQISCDEGISHMEYAVIGADRAYDGADVVWRAPQILQMSEDGFACLFINAALDMHGALTEGGRYRLLVRGVSKNNNYIMHVDIPFTYSSLSAVAEQALVDAYAAIRDVTPRCDGAVEDKTGEIAKQLAAVINNPDVACKIEVLGQGVHSMRFAVSLRYTPAISSLRLPEYVLKGQRMTDVYNFDGASFTLDALSVRYGEDEGSIVLTAPYDGDAHVILASDEIYAHAKAPLSLVQSAAYDYVRTESCTPPPVCLAWTDANGSAGKTYTVYISERADMKDAMELSVTDTSAKVYNLKVGTQYFWQVKAQGEESLVYTFITEDGYARFIKMDGVSNVRDLGGYYTVDGKRVKQGMAFRSAHLDGITKEGLAVAHGELGIRTDLDLRGGSSRPLGDSVAHISVGMRWYEGIFESSYHEQVRRAISAFAYEENYPIVFHCSMGRDRTGTTSYLILGLLGVDEDTLHREYYASFFSEQAAFDPSEFPLLVINMKNLNKGLDKYGDADDTLSQKIEAYLLDIGVTAEEIASIRTLLLEDAQK